MKRGLLLVTMNLLCWMAYPQLPVDYVARHLQEKTEKYPPELVYFQTNKAIYETGEDLWFKGYQLDAQSFGLSSRSRTLYLQLMNIDRDSVVWKEKYPIEEGIVSGHVYIDEELPEGDYFLKGYTRYSVYAGDSIHATPMRKVRIVKNIAKAGQTASLAPDSTFRFEMFPEGGNIVTGLPCKLAFKATDGKGGPVEVKGVLCKNGKPVVRMKSLHDGMGFLMFVPETGNEYTIMLDNGRHYSLPRIHAKGIAMQLSQSSDKNLLFLVSQSANVPAKTVYLVGQMRGMLCCLAKGTLKERLKIQIPLNNFLYQGIAEFTLLDEAMRPICERLVYVHPEKQLHITLETDKNRYWKREKAKLHVKVTDNEGKPVRANLGLSIYDRAYRNPEDAADILSYCYLSSQIRGNIHNPAYYFDEQNEYRLEALDLLLLTQGWRRYVWADTEVADCCGHPFLTDELTGRLRLKSKKWGKEAKGNEQLIMVSGADGGGELIWTDATGRFSVSVAILDKFRKGYVYLKPMLDKKYKPVIDIEDYFLALDSIGKEVPTYYPFVRLADKTDDEGESDLSILGPGNDILLETVTVIGKKGEVYRDKFIGRLDSLAQLNPAGPWVCKCGVEYLNDWLPGYTHHPVGSPGSKYEGTRTAPVKGKTYRLIKYEPNSLGVWYVTDIKTITWTEEGYSPEDLLRMNNIYHTKGYYGKREFYQPDIFDMRSPLPDARNTLLWLPNLMTDENGEAEAEFYCSDINTGFIGVVEGTDGQGLLGTGQCEFRVVRN